MNGSLAERGSCGSYPEELSSLQQQQHGCSGNAMKAPIEPKTAIDHAIDDAWAGVGDLSSIVDRIECRLFGGKKEGSQDPSPQVRRTISGEILSIDLRVREVVTQLDEINKVLCENIGEVKL